MRFELEQENEAKILMDTDNLYKYKVRMHTK